MSRDSHRATSREGRMAAKVLRIAARMIERGEVTSAIAGSIGAACDAMQRPRRWYDLYETCMNEMRAWCPRSLGLEISEHQGNQTDLRILMLCMAAAAMERP